MLNIRLAENGYIITENEGDKEMVYVVEHDDPVDATYSMLGYVLEYAGHSGSRYDERRVRIVIEPGDKWEPSVGA